MRRQSAAALASAVAVAVAALSQDRPTGAVGTQAATQGITVERLKSLKSTANDPAGDQFVGAREETTRLIDAIVQDASLVSPMYLFLASKTAFNLGRLSDAAFLFHAAQLRAKFDIDRYGLSTQSDHNIYLGFLLQTIGESINPAVMREPATFAAVIKRLEQWEIVPSPDAFYAELAPQPKPKLPPELWPVHAASLKEEFIGMFGRLVRLLNDPEYFEAFHFVQASNLGQVAATPENGARFKQSVAAMEAVEKRLFPEPLPAVGRPYLAKPAVLRAGVDVPVPRILRRVEPEFPRGAKRTVIVEVTIGPDGKVADVDVVRGYPELDAAVIKAVRQWVFEVSRIDGRPVSVVYTTSLTAK